MVLHSWKRIATYVGCGVRTVQRYEELFAFPIHRLGEDKSAVFAFTEEIDLWLRSASKTRLAFAPQRDLANRKDADLRQASKELDTAFAAYQLALYRYVELKLRTGEIRSEYPSAHLARAAGSSGD